MRLKIKKAGALTTVQDLGRWNYQAIGMPVSGAMDALALARGNALLGNDLNAAALEITLVGPEIEFDGSGVIAVAGADFQARVNGVRLENWSAKLVKSGDVLSLGHGCRAYVCVAGGIDVPVVMGSRSTYLKAKIGGLDGRKLRAGDELETGEGYVLARFLDGFVCPERLRPDYGLSALRMVEGLQSEYLKPESLAQFYQTEYRVSAAADRMGYRLESEKLLEHVGKADIVSDGIPMGAVQVPGSGLPIVMMADRQTTGGYVKIGVVIAYDVARLAQRLPGEPVRFCAISQEAGIEVARREARDLAELAGLARAFANERASAARCGRMTVKIDGHAYSVSWRSV